MSDSTPPPAVFREILAQAKGADDSALVVYPDDEFDPRAAMLAELRDAVQQMHHQADRSRQAFARTLAASDAGEPLEAIRKFERLQGDTYHALCVAERRLMGLILAALGRIDYANDVEKFATDAAFRERKWEPCLFELDKTYYVVTPNEFEDFRPMLVIVDLVTGSDADWSEGD